MEYEEGQEQWAETRVPAAFDPVAGLGFAGSTETLRARLQDDRVFPILLTLKSGTLADFVEKVERFAAAVAKSGELGEEFPSPVLSELTPPEEAKARGTGEAPVVTGLLVRASFLALMALPEDVVNVPHPISDLSQFSLGVPLLPGSLPDGSTATFEPLPEVELPDKPPPDEIVVTAVIDDGLPIANTRFRDAVNGTRVAYAWVQNGRPQGVSHVPYGRELDKAEIDGLLTDTMVAGQVDEDDFYRRAGLADFGDDVRRTRLGQRYTHGANVMDQAAGYPMGEAPRNPIIAVQLPTFVTADTSGLSLDRYVRDALRYILDRADRIAADLPGRHGRVRLVINFSYGFISGPHDGTHPLEMLMESILSARNATHEITAIVLPAGNSRQLRCHGTITGGRGGTIAPQRVDWRVLPDDRTPSYAVFYMAPTASQPVASRVAMRLRTPTGVLSPPIDESSGLGWEWRETPTGPVLAKISYQYLGAPTFRGRFVVVVQPTRRLDPTPGIAPSGTWQVEIENLALAEGDKIEAYVQRDDTPFGFVEIGRQSYFIDREYREFTVSGLPVDEDRPQAWVKRDGTLNAIASGHGPVVIGGFERWYSGVALFSAAGPAEAPFSGAAAREGPDAVAISDDSRVFRGRLGATTRSGGVFALSGTSIAAPQVARKIAEAMLDGTWTGSVAAWGGGQQPPLPTPPPPVRPKTRIGDGRIYTDPVHPQLRMGPFP